jgi:DNA-binding IclR family transcriptional regulator
VVRTLDILELFLQGGSLNAADVVRGTGLPRSTVHELLTTLTSRDYLAKDEAGQYSLGVALLHLGNAYAERFDLLGSANEAARELSEATKETTSVAIRQGAQVFYLAKVERRTVMQTPSNIGQRLPASCTALGKALLAAVPDEALEALYPEPEQLPRMTERSIATLDALRADLALTRRRGYATENGESTFDLHCVAVLVHDVYSNAVAALSVSVPDVRWEDRTEQEWARLVTEAADEFSLRLGYRSSPSRAATR